MEGISKDIEQVDLAFILSNAALAVKDEKELVLTYIRRACGARG